MLRIFLCFLLLLTFPACTHPSRERTYPFQVYARPEPVDWGPNRRYSFDILVPVGEVAGYGDLFEEYGYGGNGPSWAEHIRAILMQKDPAVLDHIFFNEEGDTFFVYAADQETVDRFLKSTLPIFGSLAALRQYFSHTNPDDFIE